MFDAATLARPDMEIIQSPIRAAQTVANFRWKKLPECRVIYFWYHLGRHVEVDFDGKHLGLSLERFRVTVTQGFRRVLG